MRIIFNTLSISLLFFICNTDSLLSQNVDSGGYSTRQMTSELQMLNDYSSKNTKGKFDFSKINYSGSPYFKDEFASGNIFKNNKLIAINVALRYNAFSDEVEVKNSLTDDNKTAQTLLKSPEIFIRIVNDYFVYVPYNEGNNPGGYYQVPFEGENIAFYKKISKEFLEEKKSINSITRDVPASFKEKVAYFIVDKDGKFFELPNSKNGKLKVMSTNIKRRELKNFISENRLTINKEYDLIRLIKHYDMLLSDK